jgi:hypothetical protein
MIAELAGSEGVARLIKLLAELRALERRIRGVLDEILLRRDYILYVCKLCPGEGKQSLHLVPDATQLANSSPTF